MLETEDHNRAYPAWRLMELSGCLIMMQNPSYYVTKIICCLTFIIRKIEATQLLVRSATLSPFPMFGKNPKLVLFFFWGGGLQICKNSSLFLSPNLYQSNFKPKIPIKCFLLQIYNVHFGGYSVKVSASYLLPFRHRSA